MLPPSIEVKHKVRKKHPRECAASHLKIDQPAGFEDAKELWDICPCKNGRNVREDIAGYDQVKVIGIEQIQAVAAAL